MRKLIISGLLLAVVCSIGLSFGEVKLKGKRIPSHGANDICSGTNSAWQAGEELTYRIYYNWNFVWLKAGEVKFSVEDTGDQYKFVATGRTYKSYEWFYKVRDRYESTVDKTTLLPTFASREIKEGGYRLYDEIYFDQPSLKAYSNRGRTKEDTRRINYDLSGCMHDLLSITYWARNVDFKKLKKNDRVPVKILLDKEEWALNVKYHGLENKKKIKKLGTFNTVSFSPELIEGDVFKESDDMMVWASNDENRIPLLIESDLKVGKIMIVLKDHKNLLHPMDAKIK